jgi:hypothetical protein
MAHRRFRCRSARLRSASREWTGPPRATQAVVPSQACIAVSIAVSSEGTFSAVLAWNPPLDSRSRGIPLPLLESSSGFGGNDHPWLRAGVYPRPPNARRPPRRATGSHHRFAARSFAGPAGRAAADQSLEPAFDPRMRHGVRAGCRFGDRRAAGGGSASRGGTSEKAEASAEYGDPARGRMEVIRKNLSWHPAAFPSLSRFRRPTPARGSSAGTPCHRPREKRMTGRAVRPVRNRRRN